MGQHQMNALCRWPAKMSLAGVQPEDSWLIRVVKCPLHRVWLCLDMSRQESTPWHGFAICHPVMDVRAALSLGSCAVTAISPPREMFEYLSPTPELFKNEEKGSNYQTELLECHSTKALEGLELVDLSHTFYILVPQHLQSWRRKKTSFFPKQWSSPERPQGSRTWHRLANTGERREGRKPAESRWWLRQARLADEHSKNEFEFQLALSSGKGSAGEFSAFASEKQQRWNPQSIILEFHLMHSNPMKFLLQNMEPAPHKVPAQTLPPSPWSTGCISLALPHLRWK